MDCGRHNAPVTRCRIAANSSPRKVVRILLRWFAAHARDLPWRRTRDPYSIWISEVMLQQTQVATVIPYYERWLRSLPTVCALATAAPQRVLKLWEGLGYYTRARNLHAAARHIVAQRDGRFPDALDELLKLPGVGRYTAGAVASIAFNQPAPILDGNVTRVLTRLHGIAEDPRGKMTSARLWQLAQGLVSVAAETNPAPRIRGMVLSGSCSALNQSLMELGALVCTPRAPRCGECPLRGFCVAHRTGRAGELPCAGPRARVVQKRVVAFVLERRGRFLLRQRPAGGVNAGLWEFPTAELSGNRTPAAAARSQFGAATEVEPLIVLRHSITSQRISLHAVRVHCNGDAVLPAGRWCTVKALRTLPLARAHRRVAERLSATPA